MPKQKPLTLIATSLALLLMSITSNAGFLDKLEEAANKLTKEPRLETAIEHNNSPLSPSSSGTGINPQPAGPDVILVLANTPTEQYNSSLPNIRGIPLGPLKITKEIKESCYKRNETMGSFNSSELQINCYFSDNSVLHLFTTPTESSPHTVNEIIYTTSCHSQTVGFDINSPFGKALTAKYGQPSEVSSTSAEWNMSNNDHIRVLEQLAYEENCKLVWQIELSNTKYAYMARDWIQAQQKQEANSVPAPNF